MTMVVVDRDSEYAPCSYLLCRVDADGAWDTRDEENTVLCQSDWDWPGLASNLGWVPCECGATDGTIDCLHRKASNMIAEAGDFLDEHLGEPFEDPGYFD